MVRPDPADKRSTPNPPAPQATRRPVRLGDGTVAPYPEPLDATATRIAKSNKKKDTKPEVRLRSLLHRQGLRFRKDHLVRAENIKARPDIVFTRLKIAVFVDGCFWHGCPQHQRTPKRNTDYWIPKLRRNIERDQQVNTALTTNGWHVLRIWEHEDPTEAAAYIHTLIEDARPT